MSVKYWSLKLRKERNLRLLENRVLNRIFGSKRYEVREKWRRLHNKELHALHCSADIIRVIE
jgi:hypothetical protein